MCATSVIGERRDHGVKHAGLVGEVGKFSVGSIVEIVAERSDVSRGCSFGKIVRVVLSENRVTCTDGWLGKIDSSTAIG